MSGTTESQTDFKSHFGFQRICQSSIKSSLSRNVRMKKQQNFRHQKSTKQRFIIWKSKSFTPLNELPRQTHNKINNWGDFPLLFQKIFGFLRFSDSTIIFEKKDLFLALGK